jgi:hypothetical protein
MGLIFLLYAASLSTAGEAIPDRLKPPSGSVELFHVRAEGVQVYKCVASPEDAERFVWMLDGPDAELFDNRGTKVGKHYNGPTWEDQDGSKVVADKLAAVDAPGGEAVAWLLLKARTHEGTGRLSAVTYIQRIDTWAGLPPAGKLTRADAGKLARIKYEATYVFFGAARQ